MFCIVDSMATKCPLKLGDLWVYAPPECTSNAGAAMVGYITRAGEIAVQAYTSLTRRSSGRREDITPASLVERMKRYLR